MEPDLYQCDFKCLGIDDNDINSKAFDFVLM